MILQPGKFELENSTVWSFPERGSWATHSGSYRGNWAPQIPRNIILRYSEPGDLVLDQMVGSGTTLIESILTGRNCIGVDINPKAIELTKQNLNFEQANEGKISAKAVIGDARNLEFLEDSSIDLIATHPPYVNMIKYSKGEIKEDLSNIHSVDKFCGEIKKVAEESFRVLKPGKICAILIGDTRRRRHYVPLAFRTMLEFLKAEFILKEDVIKEQWNCRGTGMWRDPSQRYNFLLIMHEHLFVFRKPDRDEDITVFKDSISPKGWNYNKNSSTPTKN